QSSVVLEVGDAAFRRMLGLNEKIPALLSDLVAERVSQNKEAFAKLAAERSSSVEEEFDSRNILKRFMRMIRR
ncbi:MAG: hypothetical protein ABIF77_13730, partial [bacterium]